MGADYAGEILRNHSRPCPVPIFHTVPTLCSK